MSWWLWRSYSTFILCTWVKWHIIFPFLHTWSGVSLQVQGKIREACCGMCLHIESALCCTRVAYVITMCVVTRFFTLILFSNGRISNRKRRSCSGNKKGDRRKQERWCRRETVRQLAEGWRNGVTMFPDVNGQLIIIEGWQLDAGSQVAQSLRIFL
jgi:hypothetical protein